MAEEMTLLLLLFHKHVSGEEIEKIVRGLGPDFPSARLFNESVTLQGLQVPVARARVWKDALAQFPEVAWVECAEHLQFASNRPAEDRSMSLVDTY